MVELEKPIIQSVPSELGPAVTRTNTGENRVVVQRTNRYLGYEKRKKERGKERKKERKKEEEGEEEGEEELY